MLSQVANIFSRSNRFTGAARVFDGNTVDIGEVRVRLHGIDAPEDSQICKHKDGSSWSWGTAATNRLADWIDGAEIECLALDHDDYGQVIGICYMDGIDVNAALIREGLAWAFTRFSDDYVAEEAIAKEAGLGIWQADNMPALLWRTQKCERALTVSPDNDPIKGYINRQGEQIYHMPWSRNFDRVTIEEAKGRRWFADEAKAEAAGWRSLRR